MLSFSVLAALALALSMSRQDRALGLGEGRRRALGRRDEQRGLGVVVVDVLRASSGTC